MSEAEPDIGLGSIVETDGRMVRVAFPAAGEERTYAQQSAPLSRVAFSSGETIEDAGGRFLKVESVDEVDGLYVYRCSDHAGNPVDVPEQQLNDRMRLNRPQDKLLARRIDSDLWFSLRYQTWQQNAENWYRTSCTSPTRSPRVRRRGCCWPTRWDWARPSKRV